MNKFKISIPSFLISYFLIISVIVGSNIIDEFWATNGYEWGVRRAEFGVLSYAVRDSPEETGSQITEERAIEIAQGFMDKNIEFFGIESYQLFDVKFKEGESFSFWMIDFIGKMHEELPPPEIYFRVLMTSNGQPYVIGDIDAYNTEISDLLKPMILKNQVIELVQKSIGGDVEVKDLKLITDAIINDIEYPLVYEIKFGDSDNREVLVDAKTGEILSITKSSLKLGALGQLLSNPFVFIALSFIVIGIIFITFFFIERIRRAKEEGQKKKGKN